MSVKVSAVKNACKCCNFNITNFEPHKAEATWKLERGVTADLECIMTRSVKVSVNP
jgi:hypothetical protein